MRHKAKKLREKRGLTQDNVARSTGTTKEYYGLIENGKRVGTIPYWIRYQEEFGLTDAELWAIAKEGVKSEGKNTVGK